MLSGYSSLLIVLILSINSFGQIFTEDFSYDHQTIIANYSSWTSTYSMGPIAINGNLSYPEYASDPNSNMMILDRTSVLTFERSISDINSNSVYCSFLLQVYSLINVTNDAFFCFGSGSPERGFIIIQKVNETSFKIGLQKKWNTDPAPIFTNTIYNINETYLLVVSYSFTGSNHVCKLWVNPQLNGFEPLHTISQTSSSNLLSIKQIRYKQTSNTPSMYIDAIRVATTWNDSALPVELSAFSAEAVNNSVVLNWTTATEVNNYGFEIERSFDKSDWECIAFIHGNGNCNRVSYYQYTDNKLNCMKTVYYRLKQIDTDGTYTYSEAEEVKTAEMSYELSQNYPNPFNPETIIKYSVAEKGFVNIKVYDVNASEVSELVNESQDRGEYSVKFNAKGLASGVYMYRISVNGYMQSRKMILLN